MTESEKILDKYEKLLGGTADVIINKPIKYDQYVARAKKKKLMFQISFQQFSLLTAKPCYICQISGFYNELGLDRINNKKGYTLDNVAPCCWTCNRAKSDLTEKEFLLWLEKISPNHKLLNKISKMTQLKRSIQKLMDEDRNCI